MCGSYDRAANSRWRKHLGPTSTKTGNATSTGRFAGATGYYFLNVTLMPDGNGGFIGPGQITGRICYAK